MAHDHAMAIAIGARVTAHRKERGLSRKQFADSLGTSENNVRRWEEGSATPHATFLVKLALALGIDVDALLGPDDPAASKDREPKSTEAA